MTSAIIFVREKRTLKFLNGQSAWIVSFSEARTFKSTWEAFDFCLKNSVHKAQIVMRFGDPVYDVTLEVH
jgi:hypothetical protein